MIVKICGITRREDAEAAAQSGASAIGFIFYKPSPRYVTAEKARELAAGLDLWKVGVFVDESAADIESVMRAAGLDIAQIYNAAHPRTRIWKAVRCGAGFQAGATASKPSPFNQEEALFLDSAANGQSFDWIQARGAAEKVIIAGGLNPANVRAAIRIAQPWGVDASSGLEISPGIKDHEKIRQFITEARNL